MLYNGVAMDTKNPGAPCGSYSNPTNQGMPSSEHKPQPTMKRPHKTPMEVFATMRTRLKTNPGHGYNHPMAPGTGGQR